MFAILPHFGGNSCDNHRKLQESQPNVTFQEFDFIVKDMLPHVAVKSLTVVKHNLLMIGIERRYHLTHNLQELDRRQQLRTDLRLKQYPQQTSHRQFLLQQPDLIPAEPELGVVVFRHVYFKQRLKFLIVPGHVCDGLFIEESLEVVVDFHPVLLLLWHDQFQVQGDLVGSGVARIQHFGDVLEQFKELFLVEFLFFFLDCLCVVVIAHA